MTARFLVALVIVFVHPPAVFAQPDPPTVMELFQAAKLAYEKGDHKTAIRKLRQAVSLVDDAPTQTKLKVTIARRLLDLDEPTEALKELKSIELKRLRRARKLRRLVADEITKVEAILRASVQVIFETLPPDASIRLNADPPQKTPLAIKLPRGDVKVVLGKPGYETIRTRINIKGTETMRRRWVLERKMARLKVSLQNEADWEDAPEPVVTLDGRPFPANSSQELEPGKHEISCTYPSHLQSTVLTVSVPAGKETDIRCSLPELADKPGSWKKPVGWASIGGGAAVLATGIGLLASWAVEKSDYPAPQYEVRSSKPIAGGIATGLGAGLIGFGTYLLLSD